MKTSKDFKTEALYLAYKIAKESNFEVKAIPDKTKLTYFFFSDGSNIGYCQSGDFGHGVRFSTNHKPNKACGTGFGLQEWDESIDEPTLKNLKESFIFAPKWASANDLKFVEKYKNFDDYFSIATNRILKYENI